MAGPKNHAITITADEINAEERRLEELLGDSRPIDQNALTVDEMAKKFMLPKNPLYAKIRSGVASGKLVKCRKWTGKTWIDAYRVAP